LREAELVAKVAEGKAALYPPVKAKRSKMGSRLSVEAPDDNGVDHMQLFDSLEVKQVGRRRRGSHQQLQTLELAKAELDGVVVKARSFQQSRRESRDSGDNLDRMVLGLEVHQSMMEIRITSTKQQLEVARRLSLVKRGPTILDRARSAPSSPTLKNIRLLQQHVLGGRALFEVAKEGRATQIMHQKMAKRFQEEERLGTREAKHAQIDAQNDASCAREFSDEAELFALSARAIAASMATMVAAGEAAEAAAKTLAASATVQAVLPQGKFADALIEAAMAVDEATHMDEQFVDNHNQMTEIMSSRRTFLAELEASVSRRHSLTAHLNAPTKFRSSMHED
jgi:hypothetical protein